jgi:osmotically-inducible protein OsmY
MSGVIQAGDQAHFQGFEKCVHLEQPKLILTFNPLKSTRMKTDSNIQQDVIDQIKWNPLLTASEIGVAVKDGVVTLSGQVDTYLQKMEAEKEAKKVAGVRAIAEDIHVGISPRYKKTDTEIAQAVVHALSWHTSIPQENIQVKVEDGIVILEGKVDWGYQRESARNAVVNLAGIRLVINNLELTHRALPFDLQKRIQAAFHRSATIDAGKIQVEVSGNKVILNGKVRSFAEKEDAEKAAWSAPGILAVENKLEVEKL